MLQFWIHEEMTRERMESLQVEAEIERLLRASRPEPVALDRRLATALAPRLIAVGTWLERRYTPSEPDCAPC